MAGSFSVPLVAGPRKGKIVLGSTYRSRHRLDIKSLSKDVSSMDLDDLVAKRPQDPLSLLAKQDLDPLSVEELALRKEVLQAEIARTESKLAAVVTFRASADALFRKGAGQ